MPSSSESDKSESNEFKPPFKKPKVPESISLSRLNYKMVKVDLKLDDFLENQETDITRMLDLNVEVPPVLISNIYEKLSLKIKAKGFPHFYVGEDTKSHFIDAILDEIVVSLKTQFNLVNLKSSEKEDFNFFLNGKHVNGNIDFCIINKDQNGKKWYLSVIESKKMFPDAGLIQCMFCLKRMYELNGDKKKVFGFCSNACHWNIVSYQQVEKDQKLIDDFKIFESFKVLFSGMERPENKNLWIQDYSLIIKVIYTIVHQKIAPA